MLRKQPAPIVSLAMAALLAVASVGEAQARRAEPARPKAQRTGYVQANGFETLKTFREQQ
jgi:hypothetical protein